MPTHPKVRGSVQNGVLFLDPARMNSQYETLYVMLVTISPSDSVYEKLGESRSPVTLLDIRKEEDVGVKAELLYSEERERSLIWGNFRQEPAEHKSFCLSRDCPCDRKKYATSYKN